MNGFKRILSLGAGLLLASGIMVGNTLLGGVPEVLEVGPAIANGSVQFTLNSAGGTGMLAVSLPVLAGDSAAVVAAKIQAAVSAVGGSTWSAQASNRTVTFSYFDGSTWSPVPYISALSNTAGAVNLLAAEGSGCGGYMTLSVNASASGKSVSNAGGSSLTVWVNGIDSPYVMNLAAGQSAASILAGIESYLNALNGSGFGGWAVAGPNTISISLLTRHAAFQVQTNDSALQGKLVLSESNGGGAGGGGTDKGNNPPT